MQIVAMHIQVSSFTLEKNMNFQVTSSEINLVNLKKKKKAKIKKAQQTLNLPLSFVFYSA